MVLLFSLSFSGCIATSREYVDLKDEIYQLQLKLNEVQKNQADLSAKMDTLTVSMDALNAELVETQNSMSLLGQRLEDVESNLTRRINNVSDTGSSSSASPAPSKVYQLAYSDFSRGKYELAMVGFKSYLEEYPNGELSDQAQYYLGECYYSQGKWQEASDEFELVEKKYNNPRSVPAARLKRALSLEQLDKKEEAKKVLEDLIKDFPNSPESYTAKDKLKGLPK